MGFGSTGSYTASLEGVEVRPKVRGLPLVAGGGGGLCRIRNTSKKDGSTQRW